MFSSLMAAPGRGQSAELALCLSTPRRLDLNQALASKCRVFVSQAAREGADPAKREPDEVPWSVASRCHRTCRPRCQRKEPFDRSLEDCARVQERGRDILQRRARRQATHHKMPECTGRRVVAGLFDCAQVGRIANVGSLHPSRLPHLDDDWHVTLEAAGLRPAASVINGAPSSLVPAGSALCR